MLCRTEEEISYLGIDEKSFQRGYSYVTVPINTDRSRVLDLVPDRKLEAAKKLLQTLTPIQRSSLKAVALDMWPAVISAAQPVCAPG